MRKTFGNRVTTDTALWKYFYDENNKIGVLYTCMLHL